jgi:hypothetical protein
MHTVNKHNDRLISIRANEKLITLTVIITSYEETRHFLYLITNITT